MAIEDAAVLAETLDAATDLPAAFAAYAEARRPRTAAVSTAIRRTGDSTLPAASARSPATPPFASPHPGS